LRIGDLTALEARTRSRQSGLCWRVGPFVLRLKTDLAKVVNGLRFLYSEFPLIEQDAVADAELSVRRKLPWSRWISINVDGAVQYNWLRERLAIPMIEWTMNVCVFQRPHHFFMLHSAVVAGGEGAAILPGRAGSGKSTLCAALVARGWRLLSDEVALIRPTDGSIQPVPRPISLKEASIEAMREFAPDAIFGPMWPGTAKGTVAHMLPPPDSVARVSETAQPKWILFPVFQSGAKARLQPLPKARALMRTADNAFNYSVLGRQGFELLADLIDRCDCFELRFDDLEQAVGKVNALASSSRNA